MISSYFYIENNSFLLYYNIKTRAFHLSFKRYNEKYFSGKCTVLKFQGFVRKDKVVTIFDRQTTLNVIRLGQEGQVLVQTGTDSWWINQKYLELV